MPSRNVMDAGGRIWDCEQVDSREKRLQTQDVQIRCKTVSVAEPVRLTVGWEWLKLADSELARRITRASPLPAR